MSFYHYWGKANKYHNDKNNYHLLVYHCLDVAAVAKVWWQASASLRRQFCVQSGLSDEQTQAWLLFFIALHDLGKFDIRFQLKAKYVWQQVNPEANCFQPCLPKKNINDYYHGPAGVYWLYQDLHARFASEDEDSYFFDDDDNESWDAWLSWLGPVAGHHGTMADNSDKDNRSFTFLPGSVSAQGLALLKQARLEWLKALEFLFLKPAGLTLEDDPPLLANGTLLAGFCSVSDWLGSSSGEGDFEFESQPIDDLQDWFESRLPIARRLLHRAGITGYQSRDDPAIQKLLVEAGHQPRQVQCLVEQLPLTGSLTLIEASTGSGKTEAALVHAWQLIQQNLADSIVFALPTQATANAMLGRIEKAAPVIFEGQINAVLAHGRAGFQEHFINLKQAFNSHPAQGKEEARVQCAQWLSESKKRVFLGQIGICTVDQVLVSVLPVRHKFVRGFGIGRSVLIIDEVHAYDAYMYGLLEEVLKQQRASGGSAILLSATLPDYQKQQLMEAWAGKKVPGRFEYPVDAPYPLITSYGQKQQHFSLDNQQQPATTHVNIELQTVPELLPDDGLLERMITAAEQGAQVCFICNLVDVAQQSLHQLREKAAGRLSEEQLILFHSRFVFADRQKKEDKVLELFGPEGKRQQGHILVSTQVFECSIDADMDWMISQLCPIDLLFQRWGRLHRHQSKHKRPEGFDHPVCTVLVPPESEDYQLHALIYGDSRILWRTQQLLVKSGNIVEFPRAYREWIEPVYDKDDWGSEPDWVMKSYQDFAEHQQSQRMGAQTLIKSGMNVLADTDNHISAVTRDGEMNLTLVPVTCNPVGKPCLLDGSVIDELDKSDRFEKISLNSLGIPASWNKKKSEGQLPDMDDDGLIWLEMAFVEQGYQGQWGETEYTYFPETGFQRTKK